MKADFYGMTSAFYSLLLQTAAYKGTGKRTYAERARELGLGPAATEVLQGTENKYVSAVLHTKKDTKGFSYWIVLNR